MVSPVSGKGVLGARWPGGLVGRLMLCWRVGRGLGIGGVAGEWHWVSCVPGERWAGVWGGDWGEWVSLASGVGVLGAKWVCRPADAVSRCVGRGAGIGVASGVWRG